jgi:metallo-beta-lactamase family protein
MSEVAIEFLGAAGTVTGSRFLLTCGETKVMIDCGMFQGLKELRIRNWNPLGVDPATISAVILTHAHLDHCGYLPKLGKDGFAGKVYLTEYTGKLADVILRDSARIQTEDAKYAAQKGFSKHNPPQALYEEADVERVVQRFVPTDFAVRTKVAEETFVTFRPSGHILGAAFVEVEFFGKRILFTGDMGRDEHPLLAPPQDIPSGEFDAIVTESTYGDREHIAVTTNFEDAINRTAKRGGSILIPAFAVDRTEVILVRLRELVEQNLIPKIPVYADSPMALKALDFYREAINNDSPEIRDDIVSTWKGRDPFDAGYLHELHTVDESKTVNNPTTPCIIISASGMGTGGRVVHHLRDMLPNPKHTVILVGHQAVGTRGRRLVEGAEEVKMHGEMVPVKASIEQVQSFSVHADSNELIAWMKTASIKPRQVFVVHGEAGVAESFAERVHTDIGVPSKAPSLGERIVL